MRSGAAQQVSKLVAEHPPAYRKVIAGWSVYWRERWGLLANSLEDSGRSWRDAESQAFVEIWKQIRASTDLRNPEPPHLSEAATSISG